MTFFKYLGEVLQYSLLWCSPLFRTKRTGMDAIRDACLVVGQRVFSIDIWEHDSDIRVRLSATIFVSFVAPLDVRLLRDCHRVSRAEFCLASDYQGYGFAERRASY